MLGFRIVSSFGLRLPIVGSKASAIHNETKCPNLESCPPATFVLYVTLCAIIYNVAALVPSQRGKRYQVFAHIMTRAALPI